MGRQRTYRSRAIVLDRTKLGETDLILTLLAESGRQVRAVAKGARKPGSRLAARCELCCDVDLMLACGRSLDVVTEAALIASPLGAAPSLESLSAQSAVAEVARFSCFEDAEDPYIFPITRCSLDELAAIESGAAGAQDSAAHLDLIVAAYIMKLLSHLGYRPDLDSCVLCGDEDATRFSAPAGGLLCSSCASSLATATPLGSNQIPWMRALIAVRFSELARAPIDGLTATVLLCCAHAWAATHLDARLRALEFMLGR